MRHVVWALSGALWLAAGGVAEAQVAERKPVPCESLFDGPVPTGTQCFNEFTINTEAQWFTRLYDAMTCPAGDELACQAAAFAARQEFMEATFFIAERDGVEIARRPETPNNPADGPNFGNSLGYANFLQSNSTSRTETVNRVDQVERLDRFETRVTGQMGGALVFDQTFDAPFTDAAVQSAVGAAKLAVTASGGPGVVVLTPTLIERTESVEQDVATTRVVVGTPVTTASFKDFVAGGSSSIPLGIVVGQASGDRGLCESADGGDGIPTGCENDDFVLVPPDGTVLLNVNVNVNVNTNVNTHSTILETTTGTEAWEIFEHWTVQGVVQAIGAIHAAVQSGGYDLGQRLLRRMGDEGVAPRGFALPSATLSGMGGPGVQRFGWVDGYVTRARIDATATTDAETRSGAGVAAGMTWVFPTGATLGFGLDHGRGDVGIAAAGETADIRLTQAALMGGIDRCDWFATGVVTCGPPPRWAGRRRPPIPCARPGCS